MQTLSPCRYLFFYGYTYLKKGAMVMASVFTVPELRAMLSPILKKYRAESASLFGSYARGDATPESDVDLIISGGSAFDKTDIFAIAEDFHIASGKNVDVYDESEIDPTTPFGKATSQERVVIL